MNGIHEGAPRKAPDSVAAKPDVVRRIFTSNTLNSTLATRVELGLTMQLAKMGRSSGGSRRRAA